MEKFISEKYQRTTGKELWRKNLQIAVFAADKIRTSLGPKGAYKMVSYNRGPEQIVKITKDPIAILEELTIQYPPVVIIAESAKMQRTEAGDGVSSYVIFLSALLKKADELFSQNIHPNTIIQGYSLATEKALEIIDQQTKSQANKEIDNILDIVDCKRNLLAPKIRFMIQEAFQLAKVSGKFDQEYVRFLKKMGGSIDESHLIKGVAIKKEKAHSNMPDRLKNLKIAITTRRPGMDRLELKMKNEGPTNIGLNIKNPKQLQNFKDTENKLKMEELERLFELNINVLLSEQPIDDVLKDKLLTHGIFALERVDKKDTEALAKATGAKTIGKLSTLTKEDIGEATSLTVEKNQQETTVTFLGCNGATFMLRGNTPQTIDELEVAIQNSLTILKNIQQENQLLFGAGAIETNIAQKLRRYAKKYPNRLQLAIQAYADALMEIPRCLAENYGLRPIETLLELKNNHAHNYQKFGINENGCIENVCLEPARIKRLMIKRAHEVSSMMLRIDELLMSKEIPKFHKK